MAWRISLLWKSGIYFVSENFLNRPPRPETEMKLNQRISWRRLNCSQPAAICLTFITLFRFISCWILRKFIITNRTFFKSLCCFKKLKDLKWKHQENIFPSFYLLSAATSPPSKHFQQIETENYVWNRASVELLCICRRFAVFSFTLLHDTRLDAFEHHIMVTQLRFQIKMYFVLLLMVYEHSWNYIHTA